MHYLLMYDYVPDILEKRGPYRDEHLRLAWAAQARGELVLGGAFLEPTDAGVLLFTGESPEAAMRFAESDPYVKAGLVTHWRVRTWMTVIGTDAAKPLRPG